MLGKINKPADNQQPKGLLLVLVQRINKNKSSSMKAQVTQKYMLIYV
jgi:hypothetical protein